MERLPQRAVPMEQPARSNRVNRVDCLAERIHLLLHHLQLLVPCMRRQPVRVVPIALYLKHNPVWQVDHLAVRIHFLLNRL